MEKLREYWITFLPTPQAFQGASATLNPGLLGKPEIPPEEK